ncbi:zinc finger CCHC domain-containing protein 24-like [Colias croceus]|uniref:zinc finger CCHC domain-containing protein 24-like n=1 Tax=Colias crocea TaxID=72248 RepID=UPI001E280D8F|nr:zinc finger CCHC domain-containing protein 24-like [Colias croceus]
MGCFSSKSEDFQRCKYCNRNPVYESNDICHICKDITQSCSDKQISLPVIRQHQTRSETRVPYFGEYRCESCKRYWDSRLCWPNSYQICKNCSKPVYPFRHRALVSSDMTNLNDRTKEHPIELCGKCKQLGHHCGSKKRILRR